jgi:hypothetical protein
MYEPSSYTSYELYGVSGNRYLVYATTTKPGDWCMARLHGMGTASEPESPLELGELLNEFPLVANRAGLVRKRTMRS